LHPFHVLRRVAGRPARLPVVRRTRPIPYAGAAAPARPARRLGVEPLPADDTRPPGRPTARRRFHRLLLPRAEKPLPAAAHVLPARAVAVVRVAVVAGAGAGSAFARRGRRARAGLDDRDSGGVRNDGGAGPAPAGTGAA